MPQSSWEFPSQFPISKVVVVPTNSFNLRPSLYLTLTYTPLKKFPKKPQNPTNCFTLYLAPPRSSKEEIPARPVTAVHPLSSLSGAEELKVAPPRFRTEPHPDRKLLPMCLQCDFFLSFQMFQAKHNRLGNFSNKCLLRFLSKSRKHSIVG